MNKNMIVRSLEMPCNVVHNCHCIFHWVIFPREYFRISCSDNYYEHKGVSVECLCKGERVGEDFEPKGKLNSQG